MKAALELYSENQLRSAIKNYRERKKKQRKRNRENELKEKLERCKKMFPLGLLIWSDDGTDVLPNVVVSEPYIGVSEWHRYHYSDYYLDDDKRTILVDTVRICMDGPFWTKNKHQVCLENVLHFMDLPDDNPYQKNYIINLKKYYEDKKKEREKYIARYNKLIDDYQKQIDECTKTRKEYEDWDPTKVTEEYAQEILAEAQKRYK